VPEQHTGQEEGPALAPSTTPGGKNVYQDQRWGRRFPGCLRHVNNTRMQTPDADRARALTSVRRGRLPVNLPLTMPVEHRGARGGQNEAERGGTMTEQPGDPSPATAPGAPARRMTPEAALGRHVEWLEFALAAARSEETWRVARLDKANKRNRDRRATRLDEVRDEIEELDALLVAIRELQARPAAAAAASSAAPKRRRGRPRKTTTAASPAKPTAASRAAAKSAPVAKAAAAAGPGAAKPAAKPAASKPAARPATPRAATVKPASAKPAATRRRTTKAPGSARGRRRATGGSSGAS